MGAKRRSSGCRSRKTKDIVAVRFPSAARLHPVPEPPVEGHGLGLSIAAKIVDLLHGTIRVENRPDGRSGALFRVTLPGEPGAVASAMTAASSVAPMEM